MSTQTDDAALLTSRQAAADWWLDSARRAARTITDAKGPAAVRITDRGDVRVDGSPRPSRRAPRNLLVPRGMVKPLAGTSAGTWWAAYAVAASRWPTRRDSLPTAALLLGVVALGLSITAGSGATPAALAGLGAALCALLAVVIVVYSRRHTVTIVQTSDAHATRIAGLDAARAALTPTGPEPLYKTALHQWRRQQDPLQPHNRLSRLEAQAGGHG